MCVCVCVCVCVYDILVQSLSKRVRNIKSVNIMLR